MVSEEEINAMIAAKAASTEIALEKMFEARIKQVEADANKRIRAAEKLAEEAVAAAEAAQNLALTGTLPPGTLPPGTLPPKPSPVKPPIMGGVAARSEKEMSVFMGGGPPKPDWSGLVRAPGDRPDSAMKFRPLNDKEQKYRWSAVATKLTMDAPNLVKWVRDINERLQEPSPFSENIPCLKTRRRSRDS
jgi:hypothetical protein